MDYKKYNGYLTFAEKYKKAINASSGSEFDPNANVSDKNVATLSGEMHKKDDIGINRLQMINSITKLYDEDLANEYIRQLESHEIYKHDETHPFLPYCVSITMYPFLFEGLNSIGGVSNASHNLQSFAGSFINLVYAVASQFAGAVSTPEFLSYLDYFIREAYGNEYYLNSEKIVTIEKNPKTIDKVITSIFDQITYTLNTPATARNYQCVFWNIAYFDEYYFNGLFGDFVFPDGSKMNWNSVSWLQKRYMKWLNQERLKKLLTFPVETLNLLDDGTKYLDTEWEDYAAEMWAQGHSFFIYRSDRVDSLSSCCFDGKQKVLVRSPIGVNFISFEDLYNAKGDIKSSLTIFHNGSWTIGKVIRLPKRQMYKIKTGNKKEIYVTDNHLNPTINGDKPTTNLTTDDYLLFNNMVLDTFPEKDKKLTYEQGYLIGMYLGDGSHGREKESRTTQVDFSINKEKYDTSIEILEKAVKQISPDENVTVRLGKQYNKVYPVTITNKIVWNFIRECIKGDYSYEKELDLNCLSQSREFRKGILDGYYLTDGGNSNRIYTTSNKLVEQVECLLTSLGLCSVIDTVDRTDEKIIIRGEEFNRNYPTHCIRWYEPKNKRSCGDLYKVRNNSIYFKIASIEKYDYSDEYVYCFQMSTEDEQYFTLPNGIITHNCRLKNEISDNTFSFTLGAGGVSTGSKGVITINVNRLVQNATKNGKDVSEAVREQVIKIHKYLIAYNEILKSFLDAGMLTIYNAGYIALKKQFLTIGINGFVEGAEYLGIKISPNEDYFKYGEMILKPIYEENKKARTKEIMFNTEFVPAENLGIKNAEWDRKDGYFVSRDCYNSYFYIVEDNSTNAIDKFVLHGKRLTKYLDGGSALHLNLDEHLTKPQYLNLLRNMIKTGCSYATINVPNTVCKDCGHISKHNLNHCEKCGSKNVDWATRIIGYLKLISTFSEGRQKEASIRHYE